MAFRIRGKSDKMSFLSSLNQNTVTFCHSYMKSDYTDSNNDYTDHKYCSKS